MLASQKETAARLDAAQARRRVAAIQKALGQFDAAAASYRGALGEVEALIGQDPGRVEYDRELGRALEGLCSLLCERGDFPTAEPLLSRALAIREDLVARSTCDRDDRADLAKTLSIQGGVFLSKNELAQAEPCYRRCRDLYRALTAETPVKATVRGSLAKVEVLLGDVAYGRGMLPEAERAFRQAVVDSEALVTERPSDPDRRRVLGLAVQKLANVLSEQNRRVESLTQHQRVEEILSRLVAEFPNRYEYRVALLVCLRGKMMALLEHEAVARQGVALTEQYAKQEPELRHYREQLATFLAFLGQAIRDRDPQHARACFERALTIRERLCAEFPESHDYRRDLATSCGQLAMNHALGPPHDPLFDPAAAMRFASRLVSMQPDEPSAKMPLAWALYRQGDWAGCIGAMEIVDADAFDYFLAMAHWQLGDRARALRIVERTDADLARLEAEQSWDPTVFPDPATWRHIRVEAAALMGLGPNPYTMPNGIEVFSR